MESRLLLAADLTGLVQSAALIDPAVPTNNASAVVQVQNVGNQRVNQSQVGVYASLDTTLDASDVLLGTANTGQVNAGQSKNVTVNLTIPNTLDPIAYRLLAKLDNANAIAENSETNNVAVGGTVNVAWKFGTVPGRSGNTTLTLRDADGTRVTFSLSGPGLGEVIRDGANWDVKVTGTTASSAVTILTNSTGNGRVTLNDIHVFGPLASLTAATTDLTGTLAVDGPVNIPGLLPGTITLGRIQGGTVALPSVEALTILGSTTNAKLYIGTTLGQDGQPGGTGANADTYGAGKIGLFTVAGAMSGTSVRVGINPVDGLYGNGNDQLIGGTGSSIGGIIIGGALSADTRFYAGTFPTQYLHGLTLKPTAGDFHFISNFSGPSLSAALQQDSGGSATDQLTNNPAITGSVTDPQGIATFVAGFGATPTVNVLSDRQPNGSFTFSQARLEQINGGLLTDGSYSLKLAATDSAGNSTQITVSFTLDTQVPVLTLDLDPASDTAPVGDQQTTNAIVTLVGQTEANALVELLGLGVQTTADASGNFSFSNVALAIGANPFTVRATDQAGNQRTEIRTITRVAVGNNAPVLTLIGDQAIDEEAQLTFTATATDADLPAQALTFSLAGTVPSGVAINPTTGVFTWTPTEAQGPGTYTFDVVVSDGIATDFETIQVTVSEVNLAPTVAAVANQTLDEATTLTLTLSATDVDLPANTLTWSLPTAPVGATIDPTTGVFTWTPTEAQGPGLFTVTARATDNGSPSLFGETTFTVTVNEVNLAPVLASIPAQTVTAGQLLSFTAAGSDADLPVNTLTYSLEGTFPAGATINATTGVFTWTPTVSQVGPQTVTVRVTDNGSPAMFAEQVVSITVAASNLAPVLGAIGNQTVNEGEPVTFTATATDADIPAQGLTFSLEGTVPTGATIDPTTGVFAWTPTEAQGPGTFTFDVVVTDNGTPVLSDSETITVTVTEVNQTPTLNPIGNQMVNEGTELRFTLSASDPDLPGQALVFGASGLPTGATFNTATREFVWTPSESQGPGTYTVTFSVTDEFATATETMTITVNEVNVAPVLDPIGNKSVIEETELRFTIGGSDVDVPVQTLVYSATGLPAGATFDPATREFVWTPTDTQGPNTYDMTFSVTDGVVTTSETITITVNEVNQAPVLTPIGNQTVSEGQPLTFTAAATDTDVPVQQLTFSLANGAAGQVPPEASITPGGLFTWTPTEAQGPGTYTFDVVVSDGTLSDSETITVTVNDVNLAPVLNLIGNQTVNEGQPLTFTATAADADLPVQTLTFSLANGATGQVPAGATIDPTTGVFTWTPTEAQGPGTFTFDVVVTDNGTPVLSDSETITVTVNEGNQTPTFTSSPTVSVQENQTQVMTVTASDADVPVQPLIYSLAGGADVAAFAITSGGALSFQTAPNFEAPTDANLDNVYEVTVQVSDGVGGIATQALQVTVTNVVENIPAISIDDITQAEGTSLAGFTAFNFTVTLSSPATDIVTVQVATQDLDATAASGDYQAVPLTTLTFGPGETTKTVTVQVRQDDLQEGTEQFRVLLSGATNATITDSTGVGTITNDDINTLSIDDATVTEGDSGTSTANFTVTLSQQPTSNVTVQVATANGTATAGSDYLAISPAQTLTFTPTGPLSQTVSVTVNGDMQLEADETFTVNLSNAVGAAIGTATGTGTILNDDFAPVLDAIGAQTVNEGEPLTFTATATDANAGQTLTFSLVNGATGQVPVSASIDPTTGVFTWTPTEAQGPGTYTFDVMVSDGTLIDSETITVTVNEVNQVPTLAPISNQTATVDQTLTFTAVGTDADLPSNALAYSLEGLFSAGATIDPATGVFTWTPTAAQVGGPHGFTVRVTDNGTPNLFAEQIVQVTVEPRPNQAPVLNPIGNQTIDEGQQLSFVANATDPDGPTTFLFSLENGLSGQVPDGAVIAGSTGQFTWTPSEAQGPGTYTFDVVVTDNGTPVLSDRETITVTVNEVSQAPSLQTIPNQTVTAGQLLTFTAIGIDPDIPANGLTYSLQGVVPAGATIDPTTGVFSWTPTNAQVGPQSVTVRVTDNDAIFLFAEQNVSITVNAQPNQAPVLAPIGNQTVNESQLMTFTATATDTDVPVQTLTFSLDGTVPPGAAIDPAMGVFTWTPTEAQGPGTYTFDVVVSDGLLSDSETITVTVNEVNQAPTLNPIGNQTMDEGQQLTLNVNATDPDGPTTFLFSLENGLSGQVPDGAVIAGSTGQFTWTPSEAQGPGTYTFDVVVTDGLLADSETITVTVNEVNLAPSLQAIPNQSVTAGQLLTFTAVGVDPDIPANSLTYSLDLSLLPPGFGALNTPTIDPVSGVFNWTPAEGQVGTHQITVRVTDNGTGALFAEQPFQVTVAASNQAPVLNPIGSQTVTVGQLLTFNATATDSDVPAQQLTFSLQGTPPSEANITAGGVFTWTPAAGQVGAHSVTVRVTDNGAPTLFDEETFTINVGAQLNPSFQGLGILPGGFSSDFETAHDVSADGNIVVGRRGQGSSHEAFRWTSGGGIVGLGDLPGGSFQSFAHGVSADGEVVVGIGYPGGGFTVREAFRWTSGGGMVGLGYFPGGSESEAYDVSADGSVVVGRSLGAFRWTSDSGMVGLGDLPGGSDFFFSTAYGVSADGSVVVGDASSASGGEAFRWTSGSGMVGLGDLPGGFFFSQAKGVSADGNVVVGFGNSASGTEAFRWTSGGGMVGLGDLLGGAFESEARGVSGDGSLVVGRSLVEGLDHDAFVWDAANGMRSLTGLLVGDLGLASGWTLIEANAVSADGHVIVGAGINPLGAYEAWRVVLPDVISVPVNEAPVLNSIGDQTVSEGTTLTFTASATDSSPFQTFRYSLAGTVPSGATINPTTGVFTWTPTEAQGPGTYTFDVVVRDNSATSLSDSETITVTVNEVDETPVLNTIGSQSVNEGNLLSFTATATAPNQSQVLTFSLQGTVPAGATIGGGTGQFTWTPTEAQGPGIYQVTVRVSDFSAPTLFDEETITIVVGEVNQAPVLAPINTQTVTVGQAVAFAAVATDADVPANQLAFSLTGTVPTGAAIDATAGAFTWAAADIPGAGMYQVTVRVTDNGSPALFHEQVVTIVVNGAPVLDPIGDRSVDEGSQLTFTATASDPNVGQTQTFTLQGSVPSGASITTGGVFTWTPTEAQGPGTYQVTVRISDNGTPVLFDEETISISVGELNQAPVLTLIADQTVTEGQIVTFFASATDADVPLNQLTFSLEGTVPAGASIDPQTGQFAWITAAGQAGGYVLTVRVTDDGTPALFSEQTVNVTILSNAASFQGLGDLPGGIFSSRPFGVSGNGAVVVGESEGASGLEFFRWTVGGGIENFATLVGSPVTAVRAASFDGSVIVGSGPAGVFRWSQTDGFQTIVGTVGGYSGNAVSSDGSVVVGKGQIDIFTPGGAFRWTSATGAVHLDTLPGYLNAEAFAVSADGNVVVGASYFGPSGEQEQAVRWVADGFGGFTVEALGDLPGGNFMSRASAVSADGTVIVGVSGSDLGSEVFRWTATEGMQRLGDGALEGAFGVSADGSVIVGGNQGNAFIWDANNGVRNLEGVLFELGVPGMDGWSGLSAEGISADGRTIVGQGTNPQGDQEAYRAVFPENLYAPVYSGPTSFSGQADSLINFSFNLFAPDVSDLDSATQQFQVRLIGNVPAGVTLDPFGFFSWTPTTSDIGVHQLTVRLYDNGVPSRFSEFQLEVTVTA